MLINNQKIFPDGKERTEAQHRYTHRRGVRVESAGPNIEYEQYVNKDVVLKILETFSYECNMSQRE